MGGTVLGFPQSAAYPQRPEQSSGQRIQKNSTIQQTFAQNIDARLEFVTDEGDVVSLSNSLTTTISMEGNQWFTPASHGQEFTMASLRTENLELTVQGDLNPEELADINRLVKELTSIAADFFSGKEKKALSGAAGIGELGSLASLSATFLQATSTTTQYTASHPIPNLDTGTMQDLQELYRPSLMETEDINYEEILQARWQQILGMLDRPQEDVPPEPVAMAEELPSPTGNEAIAPAPTAGETAGKIVEHISDTMAEHPRLSPFAAPLAMEALHRAFASSEEIRKDSKALKQAMEELQHHLFKQLRQWLKPDTPGFINNELPRSRGVEVV